MHNPARHRTSLLSGVLLLAVLAAIWGVPDAAQAAAFTVDSTADAVDATPGDGVCDDGAGNCTLRAAIIEANALPGADTVGVPAGTYTIAIGGVGEDEALTGDLDVADELTIIGANLATTIIDGAGIDRVFQVSSSGTVHISGVTVRNGGNAALASGGGIHNEGALTLINSAITSNTAGFGGGIRNQNGTLFLTDSAVTVNTAIFGGGISNQGGTLFLTRSTVSGNTASDDGGGISNSSGSLTVTNSTVSGNTASSSGGGINNSSGALSLTNSTVSGNASFAGGGVHNNFIFEGSITLRNTVIADNLSGGDCGQSQTLVSLGYNLDADGTCNLTEATDLPGTDPLLGLLEDSGGPTETHALLPGSPAIDAIPVSACTDGGGSPLAIDQRGVARPQGSACDIGAFEVSAAPAPIDSVSGWGLIAMVGVMAAMLLWYRGRTIRDEA